jgi:hypothetical protein
VAQSKRDSMPDDIAVAMSRIRGFRSAKAATELDLDTGCERADSPVESARKSNVNHIVFEQSLIAELVTQWQRDVRRPKGCCRGSGRCSEKRSAVHRRFRIGQRPVRYTLR